MEILLDRLLSLWVLLNRAATLTAGALLSPIGWLPGWLSITLVAVITGVGMIWVFKHTSHQAAIRRVRNQIKANLMALSLFKDSVFVGLRAQLRMLHGGLRLLGYSIVPLLAMTVPMALLLSQLALWFQARPLHVGEAAVVTVQLAEHAPEALRELHWADTPAVSVQAGPVRVRPRRQVCWRLVPQETGLHKLTFKWHNERYEKELAVGNGFMPVSLRRPAREWYQLLLNPREPPFAAQSAVQSIDVAFPPRKSWIAGSNSWFIYWCAVSLAAAWAARPLLQVDI